MTQRPWAVFVEADSDQAFFDCVLRHLGSLDIEIELIGGGVSHLQHVATQIRRRRDSGRHIALVLDANAKPEERRRKVEKEISSLSLPVSEVFLIPDNERPGCLEVLLEGLAVSPHHVIYDCFDRYERCVRLHSGQYALPGRKARIYAYCEALRIEKHANKRDYCDAEHWDLDAAIIGPLKEFLLSLGHE